MIQGDSVNLSEVTKVFAPNSFHPPLLWHRRYKLIDGVRPEWILAIHIFRSCVLPVRREPSSRFPVYYSHDGVPTDQNVEATQVTVGQNQRIVCLPIEGKELGKVRELGGAQAI